MADEKLICWMPEAILEGGLRSLDCDVGGTLLNSKTSERFDLSSLTTTFRKW